jgi:hypothetical protein
MLRRRQAARLKKQFPERKKHLSPFGLRLRRAGEVFCLDVGAFCFESKTKSPDFCS